LLLTGVISRLAVNRAAEAGRGGYDYGGGKFEVLRRESTGAGVACWELAVEACSTGVVGALALEGGGRRAREYLVDERLLLEHLEFREAL